MSETFSINYLFRFDNGEEQEISLLLDEHTLALIARQEPVFPFWAELPFHQCRVCPLHPETTPHCPIAVHLTRIVNIFKDHASSEDVLVEVTDSQRCYLKRTSLQNGLSPLMGIIMVTGGCPVMDPLRPLVRFHLPFASMKETEFRIISMYLVAQYFRARKGKTPDLSLSGLQQIYDRIRVVNKAFAERLRSASSKDANVNAIVILDCFAKGVPFAVKNALRDFEHHFDMYFGELSLKDSGRKP